VREEWQERFDSIPPVGWRLRVAFPERWIRIYSLPEGRRYPESDSDREMLLERQYAVAEYVLGSSPSCLFLTCRYHHPTEESALWNSGRIGSVQLAELWRTSEGVHPDHLDAEPAEITVLGATATWSESEVREALLAVANDEENLVILSHKTGCVFAPYDGGVDVILTKSETVQGFRSHFEHWLSPLESGL